LIGRFSNERNGVLMSESILPVKSRVLVTNYSPFRGLKGTIQTVERVADTLEGPYCFYLIALEGASVTEPVWFEAQEVEPIGASAASFGA
jgi:hypothetical protein